jgi:hypothetical protein
VVLRVLAGVLLIASLIAPTSADAETIDFLGVGHASVVSVGGSIFSGSVWAGELNWQWVGTPPEGFAQSFYSYCVDLGSFLRDPQTVTLRSDDGFTNGVANGGSKAAWLLNSYASDIRNTAANDITAANTQAAALQVAIWEAMYDSLSSTTTWWSNGNFLLNTTGAVRTQATAYLTELLTHSFADSSAVILSANYGQDQITHGVSEPSTLLLMGLAFIFFARLVRRPMVSTRREA